MAFTNGNKRVCDETEEKNPNFFQDKMADQPISADAIADALDALFM